MAINWKKIGPVVTLSVLGVLCGSVLFSIFFGSRLLAYQMVRSVQSNHPELELVPESLADSTINTADGTTLARFGYEFEVPWKDVATIPDDKTAIGIFFRSGRVVAFMDPKREVDRVKTMLESTAGSGKDPRAVLGAETLASNYSLVKAILSVRPGQASLLTPTNEMIRRSILLLLKTLESVNTKSGLYSVEAHGFRGFQRGNPVHGTNRTLLQLFDAEDHEISIFISTSNPTTAPITQADVNRILQTLRRADGAPVHRRRSAGKSGDVPSFTVP